MQMAAFRMGSDAFHTIGLPLTSTKGSRLVVFAQGWFRSAALTDRPISENPGLGKPAEPPWPSCYPSRDWIDGGN